MGATYTRQSSYTDGDTITAAHTNDEFNQLLAAFAASTGHTHDGTTAEGGPVTKLLGNTLTFGAGTAGTDITITFDGETSDGVLKWMEDEDYFEFSDDILVASTEKLQFRDTAIYINSSADGQLDLVADTEIQIAATTVDINGNVDISGTLTIGGAGISEAELEILDGATVTTTEINILDGDTSATSTTVADADRVVFNDAGTMKQVAVTDLAAYFDDEITAMPNLVTTAATTVGALNSGSITSGFGTIDTGSSTITTTGLITGGSLDIDDVVINGTTIGHTDDTDLITVASGLVTVAGEISVTTLDIGGTNVTSTAAELNILDGVTATASELNIMDGVTATTAELNLIDGDTTATSTTLAAADRLIVNDAGTMKQVALSDFETFFESALDTTSNITTVGALNSGSITSGFGTIDTGSSTITTTGLITGGSLDIDDVVINGTTIGHTDDTDLMTVADGVLTVAGEVSMTTLDIGGTNVTSTAAELNILDGVTATATELNYSDTGAAVGTVVASKVVTADANKDVASFRNITLTGELDAGSLDVSGDADIDGTLEADAMTLNGTAITTVATLSTGISNGNLPVFTSGAADNDFLRIDGTSIEGRSASEVLSDISAAPAAGDSNIVTTGALNSGSITSGFGSIDNGSSAITTTGVITGGTLEATADTSAGDNAAIGYTAAEGLILTGQGSTSDITVKNDADATVFTVPTGTDDILFPDDAKILIGAGSDLQLYHDGSDSHVAENGTGRLLVRTNGTSINFLKDTSETMAVMTVDGAVDLYHNNAKKLETSATGATIADKITVGSGTSGEVLFGGVSGSIDGFRIHNTDGNYLEFRPASTDVPTVMNNLGKISMGSTSPDGFLQVRNNNQNDVLLVLYDTSGSGGTAVRFKVDGTTVGSISCNASATAFNTSSDYRIKENVDYSWDATTRLKQLKPARFNFIVDETNTLVDGFIAHEVSGIVPEAITGEKDAVETWTSEEVNNGDAPDGVSAGANKLDADGNTIPVMQGIDQSKLVPLLVKTIQELEARITALEAG